MTNQNTKKPNPCEKYELAITNYVIGEKIDIPQQELFEHLAKCPGCQGDLRNWRATYATMRAREYDARPEVKQRTQAFIKELVSRQIPSETQQEINQAVNIIYPVLKERKENGKPPIPIPDLREETRIKDFPLYEALGVLSDRGKAKLHKTPTSYTAEAR